ncbi:hypothetical protein SXCC_03500 [Gluconacetobacter sp. SXCC-1]|nr:hypothetical protein SXCC_03500 [Gluconacetobacter sp. SXCC-1]
MVMWLVGDVSRPQLAGIGLSFVGARVWRFARGSRSMHSNPADLTWFGHYP